MEVYVMSEQKLPMLPPNAELETKAEEQAKLFIHHL